MQASGLRHSRPGGLRYEGCRASDSFPGFSKVTLEVWAARIVAIKFLVRKELFFVWLTVKQRGLI